MKRSQRLQPVLKVARQKAQAGMQAVLYMEQRVRQEEDRLSQLERCRSEVDKERNNAIKQTHTSVFLQSARIFGAQLETAIEQQQGQLALVQRQLGQVRQEWQRLDSRRQSLLKTQSRFHSEEQAQNARLEQREMDEISRQTSTLGGKGSLHKPA